MTVPPPKSLTLGERRGGGDKNHGSFVYYEKRGPATAVHPISARADFEGRGPVSGYPSYGSLA